MAIYYLKKGKTAEDKAIDDAQVSEVVKNTLKVIEEKGDAAVREFSEKFDNYSPKSYKLSSAEIDSLIANVSDRDMKDIKFAQEQVRNFAQAQRDSMQDLSLIHISEPTRPY